MESEEKRAFRSAAFCAPLFNAEGMTNRVDIGDIYLIHLDKRDEHVPRAHCRPVIIWGKYYDEKGNVKAVDAVHPTTAKLGRIYPEELLIDTPRAIKLAGFNKPGKIGMGGMHTYSWTPGEKKGYFLEHAIGSVNEKIFPHLIVRRAHALLQSEVSNYTPHTPIDKKWLYEGLHLPAIGQYEVVSGHIPAEISTHCRRLEKDFGGCKPLFIENLTKYARQHIAAAREPGYGRLMPGAEAPVRVWPLWPAIEAPRKPKPFIDLLDINLDLDRAG
jgi:hypothetical protein